MADVYSLSVRADTSDIRRGRNDLDRFGNQAGSTRSTVTKLGKSLVAFAAASAAAGAALGAMAVSSIKAAKEIVGLARVANATVPEFQKMAFGAKSVGIETDQLSDILKDMSDRVGDFLTTGGGPMADFFEKIAPQVGVTAEQFRKLSGPDALQLYVSSLEKANLSQSEMIFFMEAMASGASRLLPLMIDNGAAMALTAEQAEALGIALSEVDAQNITDAAKQIDRVGSVFGAFSDQIAAEISPLVSALGRQLLGLAEDAGGVGNAAATSFNVAVDAVATVVNALDAMDRKLFESETVVDQFAIAFRIGLLEIAREIVEIPTAAVNELIGLINNIPGVKEDFLGMSDFGKKITSQIDASKLEIEGLGDALEDALSKPLAGDELKRLVVEIKEEAKKSAAAARELEDALRRSLRPEVAEDDPMLLKLDAQKRGQALILEEQEIWQAKMAENEQMIQDQTLSTLGKSIGAMKGFFESGTAEYAAFVMAQKGVMAMQAIMAANLAATMALTTIIPGDPTSPLRVVGQAETIRTLGYINAGLILASGAAEVAGARAMGGSVTGGNSYMVGENGPEVVTMGGSGVVTPSSVGGGGMSVVINDQTTTSTGHDVQTQETTGPEGQRQMQVTIRDTVRRQVMSGEFDKQLGSKFDLKSKGRRV